MNQAAERVDIDIEPRGTTGRLLLRPMPGGGHWPELEEGLALLRTVDRVVVLATDEELSHKSFGYWAWLREGAGDKPAIVRLPIEDYGLPGDEDAFFEGASDVKDALLRGERIVVHCSAGIGRSGTFATAVLVALGHSLEEARPLVHAAGGSPEGQQYGWICAQAEARWPHARRPGGTAG